MTAATVTRMRTPTTSPARTDTAATAPLRHVELGDLVTIPDGRTLSVRSAVKALPEPVGTMHGWVLLGEIGPSCLLAGLGPTDKVTLYVPLGSVPAHARDARQVTSGVCSYWSPHLPGMSGAMAELAWKVCEVRGQVDPMVLAWRGRELVVFIRSAEGSLEQFAVQALVRDASRSERAVPRYSSSVVSPDRVSVPELAPAHTAWR